MSIDLIFMISLGVCFVIGLLIFKYTFVSLQEIVKSKENIPEDELGKIGTKMVLFAIAFSFSINMIAYIIYGLIMKDWSILILKILFYTSLIYTILVSFRELYEFSGAIEENAVFPNHKAFEVVGTAIYKKVSSRGTTTFIMALIFYLIPFIILVSIGFDMFTALFFSFYYIPIIMLGYFYVLGLYKSIRPYLYFKKFYSPLILIFLILLGIYGLNIYTFFWDYYEYFPWLFIGTQLAIQGVIIGSLIGGSKHRPLSMIHLFKKRRRPFEYLYIGQVMLQSSIFLLITMLLLDPTLTNFRTIFYSNITLFSSLNPQILNLFELIFFAAPPILIFMIIYNRHRIFDVGLKHYLIDIVSKKKVPIKYRYLNDRTIIESIDDLAESGIIEPRFLINLIHCLKHDDVSLRRKAVVTLRKIMEIDKEKIPLVVPYFMRLLKSDKVWTVRLEIAESLSKIVKYIPNEIPVILKYLQTESQDSNRYVRWGVLRVYESIIKTEPERAEELLPYILSGFNDKEWSVRKGALDVIVNLSKLSPKIIPKVLPDCMDLLKKSQDEDLLKVLYQFIEFCTGLEVNLENYQHIISELNSITECVDEECKTQLYANLKAIEDMKAKEVERLELRKQQVEKYKDDKYKLFF